MAYDIGAKIGIEGEAEFRQAIQGINTNLKTLGTEMLAVTSSFDKNDKSMEALTAQNKVLNKQIDEQKNKLTELQKGLKSSADKYGENDKVTQSWQQAVNKATADLNKMQYELNNNAAAMQKLSDGGVKFSEKMEKVSDSLGNIGKKAIDAGKTLSATVTAPILAAGKASFKFAADLQDAFGATDQIFNKASVSVKGWADNLESYYGISESEALTYANTMGAMLQNIGKLSEVEAAKQSQILVELAGDLTAMFGGTTESAVQALTGALKGNTSMLDNYGMGVNDATIKAKALEMGLYNGTGAMDLQTKQAATLALIMEQTADAQGQAAREAEGASGSTRSLGTELKNIATDIGEILLPIITPLIARVKELVEGFSSLNPETQEMILKIAGIAAAIGPVLIIGGKLATGVGAITGLLGSATAATGGLSAVMAALTGPIGIAIAAVAAITTVVVTLWKTNEDFRDDVKAIWEQVKEIFKISFEFIKNLVSTVLAQIQKFWNEHGESIKKIANTAWEGIKTIIDTVLGVIRGLLDVFIGIVTGDWDKFTGGLKTIWSTMWNGIKTIVEGAWELLSGAFSLVWTSISKWFTDLIEDATGWGGDIVEGLWNGIKDASDWLKGKITGFIDGIKNLFTGKGGFDMNSPSKLSETWGQYIDEGLANGIENNADKPLNAMSAIVDGIAGFVQDGIDWIDDLANKIANFDAQDSDTIRDSGNNAKKKNKDIYDTNKDAIDRISRDLVVDTGVATEMFKKMKGYATGTPFVPEDQVALIHKGEAIIPAQYNPYNQNSELKGGGDTFHVTIDARNIKDFTDVVRVFAGIKQTARQGV